MTNETTRTSQFQRVFASIRRAVAEMNHGQRRLFEITSEFDESAGHPHL